MKFNQRQTLPPADALRPVNPDNAWGLRITEASGTKFATPYSLGTVKPEGLLP